MKRFPTNRYTVMTRDKTAFKFNAYHMDRLKPYCKNGDVIVENYAQLRGVKIRIFFCKPDKIIGRIKHTNIINIFHFHISVEGEYWDRRGEVVYDSMEEI